MATLDLDHASPAERRDYWIYYAKVMIREAGARRGTPFALTLLEWAANGRRRAREAAAEISRPKQRDMFR